jgi:predicted dehydrogenase
MNRFLRVGLIGFGTMGRNHSRILSSLPGVDFVGIVDIDSNLKKGEQGRPIFNNILELIKMRIDYAIVAVPTVSHLEVARVLAESGVHALIEKPLAQDVKTSREILDCFSSTNLIVAVGHIERFNPALIEARNRIESLGNIYQIATRRQGPFPSRVSDIGVIKDLATHDIDSVMWLTSQKYLTVSSRTITKTGRVHEDLVAAIGQLENGITVSHLVNWISPSKERVTIITGDTGTLLVDTLNSDLTFHAHGSVNSSWHEMANFRGLTEGLMTRYAIAKHEPLRKEHENFRDAILGKSTDIVTLDQGLLNIIVAEAIEISSRINQTIELKY